MSDLARIIGQLDGYESVRDFLYSLRYRGAKYGLERMQAFVEALGNPHQQFKSIHVAGTNGKGSTCSMMEHIYRANGYKTGLFTSPHLIRQGERIQVNGEILSEDEIVDYTKRMIPYALKGCGGNLDEFPSFFEFMTAMAFVRFADMKVDIALIETGLGGRLDATNVILPQLSIITSISYDHMDILGDTLAEIAAEKAGIIKPDIPVITGELPDEAFAVINNICAERGSALNRVQDAYYGSEYPETNLEGSFQRINAAMALLATQKMHSVLPCDDTLSRRALHEVSWPGRWERLHLENGQQLILDATHNEEGIRNLSSNLESLIRENGVKPIIIVGTLGHDRAKPILELVAQYAESIYLLKVSQPRALSTEELISYIPKSFPRDQVFTPEIDAMFQPNKTTIEARDSQAIVVTGSIYLIGEISERVKLDQPANQQMLQDVI